MPRISLRLAFALIPGALAFAFIAGGAAAAHRGLGARQRARFAKPKVLRYVQTPLSRVTTGSQRPGTRQATNKAQAPQSSAAGARTPCLYAGHISEFDTFATLVGRNFQCALVFNTATPDWAAWEMPWVIGQNYTDLLWGKWATAPGTHRQLVITQNLFPDSEDHADWLLLGASGAYEGHARALATNLVNAGLGNAVIRLGHEANGTWFQDSIPNTPNGDQLWIQFWRNTVLAMRSVPGAHFTFDWTVNAGYRNVPLSSFYPGDDVVGIIGIDAYDVGVPAGPNRWSKIYSQPDGIGAVSAFAAAHHKPMSIPEWGLSPANDPSFTGAGDDPAYINGMAWVVNHDNVAYQTYFDADDSELQFFNSPLSIAAFRQHFGAHGDAVGTAPGGTPPVPPGGLVVSISGGPADASTLLTSTTTFQFAAKGGTPECRLDWGSWRPCSTAGSDTLTNLSEGYHAWQVRLTNAADDLALAGRTFVVSPAAAEATRVNHAAHRRKAAKKAHWPAEFLKPLGSLVVQTP